MTDDQAYPRENFDLRRPDDRAAADAAYRQALETAKAELDAGHDRLQRAITAIARSEQALRDGLREKLEHAWKAGAKWRGDMANKPLGTRIHDQPKALARDIDALLTAPAGPSNKQEGPNDGQGDLRGVPAGVATGADAASPAPARERCGPDDDRASAASPTSVHLHTDAGRASDGHTARPDTRTRLAAALTEAVQLLRGTPPWDFGRSLDEWLRDADETLAECDRAIAAPAATPEPQAEFASCHHCGLISAQALCPSCGRERDSGILPLDSPLRAVAPAGPQERASIAEIRQRATDFAEGYRAGYADGLEGNATDAETAWARSKASAELERQNRPAAAPTAKECPECRGAAWLGDRGNCGTCDGSGTVPIAPAATPKPEDPFVEPEVVWHYDCPVVVDAATKAAERDDESGIEYSNPVMRLVKSQDDDAGRKRRYQCPECEALVDVNFPPSPTGQPAAPAGPQEPES